MQTSVPGRLHPQTILDEVYRWKGANPCKNIREVQISFKDWFAVWAELYNLLFTTVNQDGSFYLEGLQIKRSESLQTNHINIIAA